jgi:tetratricopeptide (TPR) repeat protein
MARGRSFIVALLCCLLFGLRVSPAHSQGGADFTNGVKLYQDGEYEDAQKALSSATEADPNNEAAWYYLGLVRMKLNDYPNALIAFQKAVDLAPNRPGTRLAVGQIYEAQGAYDQASAVYGEEVRQRRGRDVLPVMAALGRVLFLSGQYTKATDILTRVVRDDPKYVESLYYMGRSLSALGQYDKALVYFGAAYQVMDDWRGLVRRLAGLRTAKDAGSLDSRQQREMGDVQEQLAQDYGRAQEFGTTQRMWPTLNKTIGDCHLSLKEYAEARNSYRHAMALEELGDPSDADAMTRIAGAYLADAQALFLEQGLLYQAIEVIDVALDSVTKALQKNQTYAPAHNVQGEIYLFQAKTYVSKPQQNLVSHSLDDAIKEFREALKSDPKYVRALTNLAEALLLSGKADEAKAQMQAALEIDPQRPALHATMATVLLALEDPDGALKEAETALKVDRNNVEALNAAGKVAMFYRNNLGEASDYFTRATHADPRSWESFVNLGLVFYQMESWYRARAELRKALDLLPTANAANASQQQAYLHYMIACTYHQTNMYDQEISELNDALAQLPTHLDTLRQLARAYEAQHKYRAAEAVLVRALDASTGAAADAEINVQLGTMLEREGRPHEAIAAYTAALRADPNCLPAQQGLERLQKR